MMKLKVESYENSSDMGVGVLVMPHLRISRKDSRKEMLESTVPKK